MTRLVWGEGPRYYDQGLDHGVLYLDDTAVPWNGLVSVDEREKSEVSADYYFEGQRLAVKLLTGDFEARISAYTYPDIFSEYNGYSERESYKRFGFSYRTQHGNGSKLHIVYNVLVQDSLRSWRTLSQRVDPTLFGWDIYSSAAPMPGASPASHLVMDVSEDNPAFDSLEDILYGTADTEPRLPDPEELVGLYEDATLFRIVYNGDGTYTATGPDDMVGLLEDGRFELNAPSVFVKDAGIFTVSSY